MVAMKVEMGEVVTVVARVAVVMEAEMGEDARVVATAEAAEALV